MIKWITLGVLAAGIISLIIFYSFMQGAREPIDTHQKAIDIARLEAQRKGVDVSTYRVEVFEEGSSISVSFLDPSLPQGHRGGPGFEVEINASDLKVLRSNFVR